VLTSALLITILMSCFSKYIMSSLVVLTSPDAIVANHFFSSSAFGSSGVCSGAGCIHVPVLVMLPSGVGIVFLLYPTR
jgi:hypothetical protein